MINLDQYEQKIVKELMKNPRISDNQIAKNAKIPVMTVNRKRKRLEKLGIINYYVDICRDKKGINEFNSKQLYIIKFRSDVSKKMIIDAIINDLKLRKFTTEHIEQAQLAEKDGRLALNLVLNAESETDLIDSFNGVLIPMLKKHLGEHSILDIITTRIVDHLIIHHNYFPGINIEGGIIKKDWNPDWIFVDRKSYN